jgi:hypothetical protein
MAKWIKNTSGTTSTYNGQDIFDNTYYGIQAHQETAWANNSILLTDIASGDAIVAKDDSGTTDIVDVNEAINYLKGLLPSEVSITNVISSSGIKEPSGMRARLVGIAHQTVTKNTSANVDWLISQLSISGVNKKSYFDGIQYFVKDGNTGDHCKFQIVDKDGSGVTAGLYPQIVYDTYKDGNNEFLVEEFGDSFFLVPDTLEDILLYKARLYPNLYIRVVFTSTSTTVDPTVVFNLYRHVDGNS